MILFESRLIDKNLYKNIERNLYNNKKSKLTLFIMS